MRLPVPSRRTIAVLIVLCTLLTIGAFLWLAVQLAQLSRESEIADRRITVADTDRAQLRESVEAQEQALRKANDRLVDAGEPPVRTPKTPPPAVLTGERGIPGLTGPTGPPGPRGPRGFIGPFGVAGSDGTDGSDGSNGSAGADGQDGAAGATGPAGPAGPQGDPGPAGPPGVDGKDGAAGQPGDSPFPFTFRFTVQTNPAQSTTFTVTCTAGGCTVAES